MFWVMVELTSRFTQLTSKNLSLTHLEIDISADSQGTQERADLK